MKIVDEDQDKEREANWLTHSTMLIGLGGVVSLGAYFLAADHIEKLNFDSWRGWFRVVSLLTGIVLGPAFFLSGIASI